MTGWPEADKFFMKIRDLPAIADHLGGLTIRPADEDDDAIVCLDIPAGLRLTTALQTIHWIGELTDQPVEKLSPPLLGHLHQLARRCLADFRNAALDLAQARGTDKYGVPYERTPPQPDHDTVADIIRIVSAHEDFEPDQLLRDLDAALKDSGRDLICHYWVDEQYPTRYLAPDQAAWV